MPPAARRSYKRMFIAYMRTFARMGLKAIPMRADTGPIGGDLSHEFHILAETGESAVFVDQRLHRHRLAGPRGRLRRRSAAVGRGADRPLCRHRGEARSGACDATLGDNLVTARGIEVGHIFYFGTKYSKPMNAVVTGPTASRCGRDGLLRHRRVAAGRRHHRGQHDEAGIIWPEAVAPFRVGLINLKTGDAACDAACETLYRALRSRRCALRRPRRAAGVKFADMDLIGLPWQVMVGPKGIANGMVELKSRKTGEREELSSKRRWTVRMPWRCRQPASRMTRMIFGAFERMVASRYLRARRREGFISIIAWFSLLGIALGVATLIIVMSVMNGFRAELMGRILGINGHIGVYAPVGGMTDFDALADKIRQIPGCRRRHADGRGQVLVDLAGRAASGAMVRGIRPADLLATVRSIERHPRRRSRGLHTATMP